MYSGEVTAAPGKPIAPSGEPGDKLMPLLKSVGTTYVRSCREARVRQIAAEGRKRFLDVCGGPA